MRYVPALGALLLALWPALVAAQVPAVGAVAQLRDAKGQSLALATFREAPDGVLISLSFPNPSALTGVHGIQIHAVGSCDPPDFASAGAIFNPFGKQHGLRNPDGPMAGDIPSLTIGPNGVASYNTAAPLVRLSPGPASLLRQGGTALVIFAQTDDDQTQPEGNAGARIACGAIVAGDLASLGSTAASGPQRTQAAGANGAPDLPTALLIAALGVLLMAAGVILRRAPH